VRIDRPALAAALAPGALLALVGVALAGLVAATLEPAERAAVSALLAPRAALLLLGWLVLAIALGVQARRAYAIWIAGPARLAEAAQALLAADAKLAIELPVASCGAGARALAEVAQRLARQREALSRDVDARVREAARGIEQERSRLGALMAELTQSVVVCNLDGRILLYNNRARLQFRALSDAPALADGAELIGLGRSVYAVFDRRLIAHALESIQQRMRNGAAHPSAQFVTSTRSGQLLRVQMAPVCEPPVAPQPTGALSGFVLMLHNITLEFEQDSAQDRLLLALTEGTRASLGNLQAAVDMLELPDLQAPMRERFLSVVRDEVGSMTTRVRSLAAATSEGLKTRWPLEEMLGADLVRAALRAIEALPNGRAAASEVDEGLWLRVDSFALIQALVSLAARLIDEFAVKRVQLRLRRDGTRAHLDLIWPGTALSTETAMSWESGPITVGQEATPLTVRDVVERHGGEFWFQRERTRHEAYFRFLLPLAAPQQPLDAAATRHGDSRPEYYDFDLFRTGAPARELDDRHLLGLTYTVFDTETTGLDPSQGDEIVQIGAVRIVNGKLLRQESFEQLVDPGRSIPDAAIRIHGITPAMVAGRPRLEQVLPAFHAFAADTVLVGHNAAFDLRFLQMKQALGGVRFDQPLLDTLLLSAVVHPHQTSHELEAIAGRLGISLLGRHTALGDAIVTAEVFLRLVPLLAEQGIRTLGEARAAAEKTWYARLNY